MKSKQNTGKITVVGAGAVGAESARRLVENGCNVVLIDKVPGLAEGKALDIKQSGTILGFELEIIGTENWKLSADSAIVVIAAGLTRKPGMSREQLLTANAETVRDIVAKIVKYSPESILLVVTNPVDAMTQLALKVSGFDRRRVIGVGSMVDAARLKTFLAEEISAKSGFSVSPRDIFGAYVLGTHSENMIPIISGAMLGDIPISECLPKEAIERVKERTIKAGEEIIRRTGRSASYAPSAAVAKLVETILGGKNKVLPCAVYLTGACGIKNVVMGMPAILGRDGVIDIWEIPLNPEEKAELEKSAEAAKETIRHLRCLTPEVKQI